MSEEIKLLPCPFCGSAVALTGPSVLINGEIGSANIMCRSCFIASEDVWPKDTPERTFDAARSACAAAWNRRAPQPPATVDEIRNYLDAQDALDNLELMGPNAEPHEVAMRRRNKARKHLEAALAASDAKRPNHPEIPESSALRRALEIYKEVAEEAKAQWSDDYLWEKWGMSERMAEAEALMGSDAKRDGVEP